MSKSFKYVKDFDFNEKPCNYSHGGDAKSDCGYKKGGHVSKVKRQVAASRKRVPVAPPQPMLNRLAAATNPANAQAAAAVLGARGAPAGAPAAAPGMALKKGGQAKMSKVMGEFKSGDLHSGSKSGPVVKNRKQAVAIAMSEAKKASKKA